MDPSSGDLIPCEVGRILTSHGVSFAVCRRSDVGVAAVRHEGTRVCVDPWAPWLAKTILMRSRRGSALAIALCPVEEKVDLRAVAHLMQWQKARLATPLELRAFLRPDQDELSPLAADGLPVLVDAPLARSDRVLVNSGALDLYLEVPVPDLLRVTQALCARLALPRWRWE